ncbi:MAG: glycoside hydrolase family 9 protein [Cyanobacteria bacterium P01_H01_bin.74]
MQVCILVLLYDLVTALPAQAVEVLQSSIGYHPEAEKYLLLKDIAVDSPVEMKLIDLSKRNSKFPFLFGKRVYKTTAFRPVSDNSIQNPGSQTIRIDFTDFKTPGNYKLKLKGVKHTLPQLKINDFIYWDILKPSIKTFYYQRCGQSVRDDVLDIFHSACHVRDATLAEATASALQISVALDDGERDVTGGWHNGSDYAKYVTSTALSASQLMGIYNIDPQAFRYFRLGYSLLDARESSEFNDLLHETKVGIDWLLAMQRRDGAVYRKVSGKRWPAEKMPPHDDDQDRYVFGVSTQETANTAATLAIAARTFQNAGSPSGRSYGIKCLLAAEKAWQYLSSRPVQRVQLVDASYLGSGEFIDDNPKATDLPYRLWAAAELFVTTGKPLYQQFIFAHLPAVEIVPFTWRNPALLGLYHYCQHSVSTGFSAENLAAKQYIKQQVSALANHIATAIENTPYASGLSAPHYAESSNRMLLNRLNVLLIAADLTGELRYRNIAGRSLLYLFELNPLGKTFVTGLPLHAVNNLSHRWVRAMEKPLLGFLVDGPNPNATDSVTPRTAIPALAYVDDAEAASSNASSLLNNAALAFSLGLLNHLYNPPLNPDTLQDNPLPDPLNYKLAPSRPQRKQ